MMDAATALGVDLGGVPPAVAAGGGAAPPAMGTLTVRMKRPPLDAASSLGVDLTQHPAAPLPPPVGAGLGQNFAAGANRAIAGALGAPVDLLTGAINNLGQGPPRPPTISEAIQQSTGYGGDRPPPTERLFPEIQNPIGGSVSLQNAWGKLTGTNPGDIQPVNEPERIAAAAGGAVAQIPLMAAGGAALEGAGGVPGAVGGAIRAGSGATLPQVANVTAATGVGAGVGQAAEDASPEPLKPLANLAGNLAGAGGMLGATTLTGKYIVRPVGAQLGQMGLASKTDIGGIQATNAQATNAAGQVTRALGDEGRNIIERSVANEEEARDLEAQLADPATPTVARDAATARLQQIQGRRVNLVPETKDEAGNVIPSGPTTSQLAPTPGSIALEKAHRVANPGPWIARDAAQNNARLASIDSVQPEGSVGDTVQHLLSMSDAMESEEAGRQANAGRGVQETTEPLGGTGTPGAIGADVRAAVAPQYEAAVGGARQGVQSAAEGLGGEGAAEDIGETVREPLVAGGKSAKAGASRLWQAIDPEGKLAMPLTGRTVSDGLPFGGLRETARGLLGELDPQLGDTIDPKVEGILKGAAALPDVIPFRAGQRLRTNIGDTERRLRANPGNDQDLRRLGMMKASLDDTIGGAADTAAAADPGVAERLAAMAKEETGGPVSRAGSGQGNAGSPAGATAGVSGASRGQGATQRGRGTAPGNSAVADEAAGGGAGATAHLPNDLSEDERELYSALAPKAAETPKLEPNFNEGAREDYAAARASTLAYKTTYGQGPVGEVLRPGKLGADYAVENADVTRKFLNGRPTEPDNVRKYIAAVGGDTQAVAALRDGLVSDLRKAPGIFQSDGAVNPDAFAKWIGKRGRTIDLFPGLRDQLGTVAKAQELLDRTIADQGVIGKVMKEGPAGFAVPDAEVTQHFLNGKPTEPANVARYIKAVGGDAAAVTTLRDGLISDLRAKGTITPEGLVKPEPYAAWMRQRGETINQFPGLRGQLSDAATAQNTLDTTTAEGVARIKAFQNGVAKNFLNEDPDVAVRRAFSGSPTKNFAELARLVRGNPDAEAGLKRGVVDYIIEKTRGSQPTGAADDMMKADTFRRFIRGNSAPLKALFGGQGVQTLDMVAADLRRAAQRSSATGGSDTAANVAAGKRLNLAGKQGAHLTALAVVGDMVGRLAEHAIGGEGMLGELAGVAAAGGGYLLHSLRQAGIATTNDLVREAMLHPALARELMQRADAEGALSAARQRRLAGALGAAVAADQAVASEGRK
jgi:hypothetical protein